MVLVRHGESELNHARVSGPIFFETKEDRFPFVGVADHKIELTTQGERQSLSTGVALAKMNLDLDFVYDSGYVRTVKTLDNLLEGFSEEKKKTIKRKQNLLIRERESGYTYFMTKSEVEESFPWYEEYWSTLGPVLARPIGGESIADLIVRIRMFLDQTFKETAGKNILISCHGRVLSAMRYLLEDWTFADLEHFLSSKGPRNCGVTIYSFSPESNRLCLKEYDTCYW